MIQWVRAFSSDLLSGKLSHARDCSMINYTDNSPDTVNPQLTALASKRALGNHEPRNWLLFSSLASLILTIFDSTPCLTYTYFEGYWAARSIRLALFE